MAATVDASADADAFDFYKDIQPGQSPTEEAGEAKEAKEAEDLWGIYKLGKPTTLHTGSVVHIYGLTLKPVAVMSTTPLTDGQLMLGRVKGNIVQILTDEGAREVYGKSIAEISDVVDFWGFTIHKATLTVSSQGVC